MNKEELKAFWEKQNRWKYLNARRRLMADDLRKLAEPDELVKDAIEVIDWMNRRIQALEQEVNEARREAQRETQAAYTEGRLAEAQERERW